MSKYVEKILENARKSSYRLASLDAKTKNNVLLAMAKALLKNKNFSDDISISL